MLRRRGKSANLRRDGGKTRTHWKDTQEQKGGLCGCCLLKMLTSLARCRGRAGKGLCREPICGSGRRTTHEILVT